MRNQEGLLFALSGEQGCVPEAAMGNPVPNFFKDVEIVEDGVNGKALRCLPTQLFSYWAPGNMYAQRGSLSFFWRSRTPLGETEFPLFRVSFADHSSWDALFLRIDYNGHGIDAFVTDINLSRIRVSCTFENMPKPDQWFHIGFAWDETVGVRLYIDGKLAAAKDKQALLYAGLDQFGTHSRIISNAQVQSSYNYMRTGDFDEIRVYDRMLDGEQMEILANAGEPELSPMPERSLLEERWRQEWETRYGFNGEMLPAPLVHPATSVRKVEIHDAWDQKRWWWKGCDGIRETTWPGVYNRSGLPGRTDYFVLPDWDCYSISGKEITFEPVADEYFNHIEISGSAAGRLKIHGRLEEQLDVYRASSERSVLRLPEPVRNVSVTFTNDVIEEPIGDITLLEVEPGMAPDGVKRECFVFEPDSGETGGRDQRSGDQSGRDYGLDEGMLASTPGVDEIRKFIDGRYMEDEKTMFIGRSRNSLMTAETAEIAGTEETAGAIGGAVGASAKVPMTNRKLPICHLLMPYQYDETVGMDGLLLHLPALDVKPSHGEFILVNIQLKDPLWLYRNLIQFTFALRPNQKKDIWLDCRDRILPEGKALYATIACSSAVNMSSQEFQNITAEIIYKPVEDAKKEHIEDRWIQVKDNYANLVEENPSNEHFNMFNRFKADITDLLRICPEHKEAREYWFDKFKTEQPDVTLSKCPDGIPLWAWRQTEYMGYVKRYIRWWIDKRQIENGEFGGGLSDDGDLTAWWPGPAMTGCMPEKIEESLTREMEAFYDQGMFANGLCAIQTDQLHTLEEGIQCLGQCLTLVPHSPKYIERAMENARGLFYITGYNKKGHRHLLSGYYSGTRIATEPDWSYSASDSFHVFHPTYMLVRYNGSPKARNLVLEMADSMLEHYYDGNMHVLIDVESDTDEVHERTREWPLFYAAWQFTGDRKYLAPIDEALYRQQQERYQPKTMEFQAAADYEELIKKAALREYINTDGQLWVDRGVIDIARIQQDRIGGVGHERFSLYPRHDLRWHFKPSQETDVAILVTYASLDKICLTAYNMTDCDITARMTMEDVLPGMWKAACGYGASPGETDMAWERTIKLERFEGMEVVFRPACYTSLTLELAGPGTPYWERPDLAIDREDVLVKADCIRVRVHNLGARESALTTMALKNADGTVLRSSQIPPIPAPDDLYPKVMEIPLWTRGLDLSGCYIELDSEQRMEEITRANNVVYL